MPDYEKTNTEVNTPQEVLTNNNSRCNSQIKNPNAMHLDKIAVKESKGKYKAPKKSKKKGKKRKH